MAEKRHEQSGFKVTDRRLFTSDGELRSDAPEEVETPKAAPTPVLEATSPAAANPAPPPEVNEVATPGEAPDRDLPVPPSSAEQEAQAAAYKQSAKDLDSQVELSGHSAKEFE